jgi:hypothetical protein
VFNSRVLDCSKLPFELNPNVEMSKSSTETPIEPAKNDKLLILRTNSWYGVNVKRKKNT